MTTTAEVRRHIDGLEAIQRELGSISQRSDPERAHDLVQGRRALAAQVHVIMLAGDSLLSRVGDAELRREFRRRFSAMRAAAAALQAEWPAIKVRDVGGAEYAAAVAAVRASDKACIAWTRDMLDGLEHSGEQER